MPCVHSGSPTCKLGREGSGAASPYRQAARGVQSGSSGHEERGKQFDVIHGADSTTRHALLPSPVCSHISLLQFEDKRDAEDAQHELDRSMLGGQEIAVQFAMRGRRRPAGGGPMGGGHGGGERQAGSGVGKDVEA